MVAISPEIPSSQREGGPSRCWYIRGKPVALSAAKADWLKSFSTSIQPIAPVWGIHHCASTAGFLLSSIPSASAILTQVSGRHKFCWIVSETYQLMSAFIRKGLFIYKYVNYIYPRRHTLFENCSGSIFVSPFNFQGNGGQIEWNHQPMHY